MTTAETLRPLGDHVYVLPIEKPKVSDGGIHLPDIAELPPQEGVVIAVGKGKLNEDGSRAPMTLSPGNRVLFMHWAGQVVRYDGSDHYLLTQKDVIGLID